MKFFKERRKNTYTDMLAKPPKKDLKEEKSVDKMKLFDLLATLIPVLLLLGLGLYTYETLQEQLIKEETKQISEVKKAYKENPKNIYCKITKTRKVSLNDSWELKSIPLKTYIGPLNYLNMSYYKVFGTKIDIFQNENGEIIPVFNCVKKE